MTVNRYWVSLAGGDENILKLDYGDGCKTINILVKD